MCIYIYVSQPRLTVCSSVAYSIANKILAADGTSPAVPPIMSELRQLTKGMPVEYQPYPLIIGTKAELVALKKVKLIILDTMASSTEYCCMKRS